MMFVPKSDETRSLDPRQRASAVPDSALRSRARDVAGATKPRARSAHLRARRDHEPAADVGSCDRAAKPDVRNDAGAGRP